MVEDKLEDTASTEQAHSKNRRVVIRVVGRRVLFLHLPKTQKNSYKL
jgi:hypothetical protein